MTPGQREAVHEALSSDEWQGHDGKVDRIEQSVTASDSYTGRAGLMAAIYRFDCGHCGHRVQTSTGQDLVMRGAVKPVLCRDCKAITHLFHEYSGDEGWTPFGPGGPPDRCPDCGGSDIEDWVEPFPCPRCGTGMEKDPEFLILAD